MRLTWSISSGCLRLPAAAVVVVLVLVLVKVNGCRLLLTWKEGYEIETWGFLIMILIFNCHLNWLTVCEGGPSKR
ncbi:hypothetical protein HanRHA438_Chr15g0688881 [Helianthus annuus]|nr:hypothetical protein HanRHA438_Chr15g0688881 [Helianthus annuus]